jgi:hypothetical protein
MTAVANDIPKTKTVPAISFGDVCKVDVAVPGGAALSVIVPQPLADKLKLASVASTTVGSIQELHGMWGDSIDALLTVVREYGAERSSLLADKAALESQLRETTARLAEQHAIEVTELNEVFAAELSAASTDAKVAEKHAVQVTNLSAQLAQLKASHSELQTARERLAAKEATLTAELTTAQRQLNSAAAERDQAAVELTRTAAEAQAKTVELAAERDKARAQADNLLKRSGQNHIKRDWERMSGTIAFPAGSDLRDCFVSSMLNFESFACDAVFALENLGHAEDAAPGLFVSQVMLPMYEGAKGYVDRLLQERREKLQELFGAALPADLTEDTVPKLFWYLTLQTQLPPLVKALTDAQVAELVQGMGGQVAAVQARMLEDAAAGQISDTEGDLRVSQIVRALLLLFTHAALSDPNCHLQPAPGAHMVYHPDRCKEVLSPGAKRYGQIKEGDVVEVVLCGLYFEDAEGPGQLNAVKPVIPCLVRRLLNSNMLPPPPTR